MRTVLDRHISLSRCRGFSLIEALVATVIFSIGLVGLGLLQTKGLQFSRNAYVRTQATVLTRELADRMRANPAATEDGLYVYSASALAPIVTDETADCVASACSPADMAGYDLSAWWEKVRSELPTATASVVQNGPGGYRITVLWDDTGTSQGTPSCPVDQVSGSSGWQCYRIRYVP